MTGKVKYVKKLTILYWVFVIVCLLAYQLSISKMLQQRLIVRKLQDDLAVVSGIKGKIAVWNRKLTHLNTQVIGVTNSSDRLDNNERILLDFISTNSTENRVTLLEFSQPKVSNSDNVTIETRVFTLQGDFKGLLKFTNALEQMDNVGRLSAIYLFKQADKKSGKFYLCGKFYLQIFKTKVK